MPDPVSIASATATTAFKICMETYGIVQGIRKAPAEIQRVATDLEGIYPVLGSLSRILNELARKRHNAIAEDTIADLNLLLDNAIGIFKEIREKMSRFIAVNGKVIQGLWERFNWDKFNKDDVWLLRSHLSVLKSSINLALASITMFTTFQAHETAKQTQDKLDDLQKQVLLIRKKLDKRESIDVSAQSSSLQVPDATQSDIRRSWLSIGSFGSSIAVNDSVRGFLAATEKKITDFSVFRQSMVLDLHPAHEQGSSATAIRQSSSNPPSPSPYSIGVALSSDCEPGQREDHTSLASRIREQALRIREQARWVPQATLDGWLFSLNVLTGVTENERLWAKSSPTAEWVPSHGTNSIAQAPLHSTATKAVGGLGGDLSDNELVTSRKLETFNFWGHGPRVPKFPEPPDVPSRSEATSLARSKLTADSRRHRVTEEFRSLVLDWKGHDVSKFGDLTLWGTFRMSSGEGLHAVSGYFRCYLFDRIFFACQEVQRWVRTKRSNPFFERTALVPRMHLAGAVYMQSVSGVRSWKGLNGLHMIQIWIQDAAGRDSIEIYTGDESSGKVHDEWFACINRLSREQRGAV
ncbi:Guanine nucleotide exchange factor for Cdc42p [Elasticomyces elasticus]|nr:Guanine nucleotide exchange factor for Cdc42p [Elasticomyces elasticus]